MKHLDYVLVGLRLAFGPVLALGNRKKRISTATSLSGTAWPDNSSASRG
jgi:hypothetical protein